MCLCTFFDDFAKVDLAGHGLLTCFDDTSRIKMGLGAAGCKKKVDKEKEKLPVVNMRQVDL